MSIFIKSWKTTACGLLGGALVLMAKNPSVEADSASQLIFTFLQALSVVAMGYFAKDADKTGASK